MPQVNETRKEIDMNNSNQKPLWELAEEQVDSRLKKTRPAAREAASKAARELDKFDYDVETMRISVPWPPVPWNHRH